MSLNICLECVLNTLIIITNPKIGRAQVIFSLPSLEKFESGKSWKQSVGTEIWSRLYDLTMTFFISSRQLEFLAKYKRQKYFLKKGKCQIQWEPPYTTSRETVADHEKQARAHWETTAETNQRNLKEKLFLWEENEWLRPAPSFVVAITHHKRE